MANKFELREDGTVALAPGRYFIGDPCRLFDGEDPRWDELLRSCEGFSGSPIGSVDGLQVAAYHTAHGDGCYAARDGGFDVDEILVDSGLIGIAPAPDSEEAPEGMFEVEAEAGDACSAAGGVLWFGQISVDTTGGGGFQMPRP